MGFNVPKGPAPLRRIELTAPAKVNLYLGVHPNPVDDGRGGRHLVDTIMHTVSLADTLVLEVLPRTIEDPDGELECVCRPDVGVPQEKNLAYRAVYALAERVGRTSLTDDPDTRLRLTISKQTPAQAGMGGGSSDAAAAIAGAATLWGVDPLGPEAIDAARSLGSDIPFFLEGGALRMEGYGDVRAERYEPLTGALVVVKPDAGVSTGACYAAFDADPEEPADRQPLVHAFDIPATPAKAVTRLAHAALSMANNLAPAAEGLLPELAEVREWLEGQPAVLAALLSGSGSATFGVCGTESGAFEVARAAQAHGWYATTAWFTPHGVRVVEDRRASR